MMGSIHLILGPMASGKSSELLRLLTRASIAKKKPVILFRSQMDTRDFLTRNKTVLDPSILQLQVKDSLLGYVSENSEYLVNKTIGIDEGQFFKDLAMGCQILTSFGSDVVVSGLNGTSERGAFSEISELIPYVETITKLNAICSCCGSEYGAFTHYKGDKTKDTEIKVGGDDLYEALCRDCYHESLISESLHGKQA